ncbi:serine-enriched protein [Caerostris extrusa]|uniref:Serine-enriched protein n=1 Tax=Caerostris extrusa TaxID=172846 RepID=A0AAV4MMC5_CAEEX|nr:serine-enriched protein [Caerostris extrusa]
MFLHHHFVVRFSAADMSDEEEEDDYSVFENKMGLAEDMKFLASMPELCATSPSSSGNQGNRSSTRFCMDNSSSSSKHPQGSPREEARIHQRYEAENVPQNSEPLLNIQAPQMPTGGHQTLIVEEFEPDVFRQLIEYIHTGCVTLQARTLLGLMNAADYYGLDELRKACMGFDASLYQR